MNTFDKVGTCSSEQPDPAGSSENFDASLVLSTQQIDSIKKTLVSLVKETGMPCEIPTFDKLFKITYDSISVPGYFGGWYFEVYTIDNKITIDAQLSSRMSGSCEVYTIDSNGNILSTQRTPPIY